MPDRRFTLPTSPEKVFPGSELDGIRCFHDDIVLSTDADGVHVTVPETVDPDTTDDVVFNLTQVHGFTELG